MQQSPPGFAELRLASLCEARPSLRDALRIPHATPHPGPLPKGEWVDWAGGACGDCCKTPPMYL